MFNQPEANMQNLPTQGRERSPFWRSRCGIGWLVLAGIAGWFLWTEHRAHLFGALTWLVLLACPLMHVFMHRGHHGSHGQGSPTGTAESASPSQEPGTKEERTP